MYFVNCPYIMKDEVGPLKGWQAVTHRPSTIIMNPWVLLRVHKVGDEILIYLL